jgi:hypothetical protein
MMFNRASNKRSNADLAIGLAQALAAALILAAWEQLPLEVKNRLEASIRPPVALRLAR